MLSIITRELMLIWSEWERLSDKIQ